MIVSYLKVESAVAAFGYFREQKLNKAAEGLQVDYIHEDKTSNLPSINESVDSDKSDQESGEKKNSQEEIKEDQKVYEETRYFTPFRLRPRFNQLTPSPKNLNMTLCVDQEDSYSSYHPMQRTYSGSYYNTSAGSVINTETTNFDSDEALSSERRTDLGATVYL